MWSCTEESCPDESTPSAADGPRTIIVRPRWDESDYPLARWDPRVLSRPPAEVKDPGAKESGDQTPSATKRCSAAPIDRTLSS